MGYVKVEPEGLHALGLECHRLADGLADAVPPTVTGLPAQATVAAVAVVNVGVRSASGAMVARMMATGAKLSGSAVAYTIQDEQAASRIGEVSPTYRL